MSGRTPEQLLAEFGRDLVQVDGRRHIGRAPSFALATVAAAIAAIAFVGFPLSGPRDVEVVVPPGSKAIPRATWPPKVPRRAAGTEVRPLAAESVRPSLLAADPAVREDVAASASGAVLAKAWSVPEMKGHVHLIEAATRWCLSVPDAAADQPEVERGKTCATSEQYQSKGISLAIGSTVVAVVADGTKAPIVRTADGNRERLPESDGLVVAEIPDYGTVTLFDRNGRGRTHGFKPTVDWDCPDGRRGFRLPVDALPPTDPCLQSSNTGTR